MTGDDGLHFRTAISEMDDEEIYVRGYPLSDLIRRCGYAECTFLTLRGELPTPAQAAVFEAVLCALMSYPAGRGPNILAGRIVVSVNPEPALGILAALSCAGPRTISPEHAGEMLAAARDRLGDAPEEADLEAVAAAVAGEWRRAGGALPGVGHPEFTGQDPRATALLDVAGRHGIPGAASRLHDRIVAEYNALRPGRPPLPLNIDGAMARVLTELGFSPPQMHAVSLISFLPGIAAHMVEEAAEGTRFRMLAHDHERYVGPPRRDVPPRRSS